MTHTDTYSTSNKLTIAEGSTILVLVTIAGEVYTGEAQLVHTDQQSGGRTQH